MAIASEKLGRSMSNAQETRVYIVREATSDTDALSSVLSESPAQIGSKYRDTAGVTIEDISPDSGIYLATVEYKSPQLGGNNGDTGSFSLSIDVSSTTQKITQSIETIGSYGTDPPDYKGAINVSSDGNIEGVDIRISTVSWRRTVTLDDDTVTNTYIRTLASLVGTVNNATFYGFEAGEVLFTGANGQKRADDKWDITFVFEVSYNRTGISVGDITGITKDGWDLLWVQYAESEQTVGGSTRIAKTPAYAYVERVYERGNFTTLGIGTS